MSKITKTAAILASAAAGIAIGILSAPKSGKETRDKIRSTAKNNGINVDALNAQFEKQKNKIVSKTENIVSEFNEFIDDNLTETVEAEVNETNDLLFEKIDIDSQKDEKIESIKNNLNNRKLNLKDLASKAKKRTSSLKSDVN